MNISHLSLTNFRNYPRLEYSFQEGISILYGDNAQGKTNILESIYYLATSRSPYTSQDQQIINWQADQADELIIVSRIMAQIVHTAADQSSQIELRLIKEIKNGDSHFRREALINRRKVRLMDLLGHLRVVLFLPTDLELITGSPAQRRRHIDISLCQTDPVYCRTLSSYNKILEQRNAALRQINQFGAGRDVISILNDKLISAGTTLFKRRAQYIDALSRAMEAIHYEHLTQGSETIRIHYLPRLSDQKLDRWQAETSLAKFQTLTTFILEHSADDATIADRFREAIEANFEKDIAAGSTTIGPHRDDWQFQINSHSLADYGSRGQQRTAILAYKLAEIGQMEVDTGESPLLLLDDVVAELDENRRTWLFEYIADKGQTFITSTDLSLYPDRFLEQASAIFVQGGRLETESHHS